MDTTEFRSENSEPLTLEIEEKIKLWKEKAGNTIMVLHAIQNHYGYVPRNISLYMARELDIPLARIYEVLTFYNYFKLEPRAEINIQVCTGTACYLKGAGRIISEFKQSLGMKSSDTYSEDRKFKIEEVRCIGCCGLAPVIQLNEEVKGRLEPGLIQEMVQKLRIS